MPRDPTLTFDVVGTMVSLLFESVPRKRAFLIFGEERVPVGVVIAAQVVISSVGLAAGASWPERAKRFLNVREGSGRDEVVENVSRTVEAELQFSEAAASALRLWGVAGVEDSMIATIATDDPWHPLKNLDFHASFAYANGVAAGIKRSDSSTLLASWLEGIANCWDNALESGLAVDGAAPNYDSFIKSVSDLFDAAEADRPTEEPPTSWPLIEYLWRFETFRLGLLVIGSTDWRAPEQEKYRGILY